MACTTLLVTSPSRTITLSNVGFGSPTQRYAVCTTLANQDIATAWIDYVITNPLASNNIEGTVLFTQPGQAFPTSAPFSLTVTAASGTIAVPLQIGKYVAGNYTGLSATANLV